LNMFKNAGSSAKSMETRRRILDAALLEFRVQGFETATMRSIAKRARMSLGSAYYYFPTKEAIVMAYYESVQAQHAALVAAALPAEKGLRQRLGLVIHSKLDLLAEDRELLGALLRFTGQPQHPLSFLGPGTRALREDSMRLFADALAREKLSPELHRLVVLSLWGLHMGVTLFFLYDDSKQHRRTRRLLDGALDLSIQLIRLARFPLLRPIYTRVTSLLQEVELLTAS
jgi:AcrR family transcriptional regulator